MGGLRPLIATGLRVLAGRRSPFYLRGARFAVQALGFRHRDLGEEFKEDAKAYVAEMDRYLEAVRDLRKRVGGD